ncbi:MAG: HEAT repeat domain-containing protein [Gammaproteobacteria bacterium]
MKLNKTGYLLIASSLLIVILIAMNYQRILDLAMTAYQSLTSNETSSDASQMPPPSTDKPQLSSSQINQLLQQRAEAALNPPPIIRDSENPEERGMMEEALNDFYSSEDEQDREAALMTLGEFPDPKAKDALLYALNDPDDSVREQAVSQIGNWEDDTERQQMLLTALNNDKPDIVVLALESIAEADDPALLQKIKELSSDKNEDISEAAQTALEMAEEE